MRPVFSQICPSRRLRDEDTDCGCACHPLMAVGLVDRVAQSWPVLHAELSASPSVFHGEMEKHLLAETKSTGCWL